MNKQCEVNSKELSVKSKTLLLLLTNCVVLEAKMSVAAAVLVFWKLVSSWAWLLKDTSTPCYWTKGVENNNVKIIKCFCVSRAMNERWHQLIFMSFDIRHLYVSDGCSCVMKGQRHSIFLLRTVLSDTDTAVGKSLGWNKELFRASWLLLKV